MKHISTLLISVLVVLFSSTTLFGQLSGDYIIGTGQTYTTLGAAITALNLNGASGSVRFLVDENLSETGSPVITSATLNGANTLVIKPNVTKTPTVTFSACAATGNNAFSGLTIDGATCPGYVTIDGSNTNGGTTSDMTFAINDATNGSFCIKLNSNTDNVTIKYLNIQAQSIPGGIITTASIHVLGGTTAGNVSDNLTITKCLIGTSSSAYAYGINISNGSGGATFATGIAITDNVVFASARGLNILRANDVASTLTITGNTVSLLGISDFTHAGLYLENFKSTVNVGNNKFVTLKINNSSGTSDRGGYGIYTLTSYASTTINIYNNFVSDYWFTGTRVNTPLYGIFCDATNAVHNVFYNTVYVNNDNISSNTGRNSALRTGNRAGMSINLKNNILVNTVNSATSFGIDCQLTTALSASDFNDIYVPGASAFTGFYTSNRLALSDWQTATGKDGNSITLNPANAFGGSGQLTSVTDLHWVSKPSGSFAATPLGSVTTDIDGDTRDVTYPYMGADEIAGQPLPVELTSFTATLAVKSVELNWSTATEVNNYGFELERQSIGTSNSTWRKIAFVEGHGTTNTSQQYAYKDIIDHGTYAYRLKQIDQNGNYNYSNAVEVAAGTGVYGFTLRQNYPNPFNPGTRIVFSIGTAQLVTVKVFDILGREVRTLVNETKSPGAYDIVFNGEHLSSGMYICRLQAGNNHSTMKMILSK